MSEGSVSVERHSYALESPFFVIATQNPLEHQGTFPLPESQLDRFSMSIEVGYPDRAAERELVLLSGGVEAILERQRPVLSRQDLLELQERVTRVRVAPKLADYMLSIADTTRKSPDFALGVSTRGLQSLFRAVQAQALCEGRDFATPDDVQKLAVPVLAHRIVLRRGDRFESHRKAIEMMVAGVPLPI